MTTTTHLLQTKEEEIRELLPMIEIEALKCWNLMKRPTGCEVTDLINDGIILLLEVYDKYEGDKSATFPTFFRRCLINHLNTSLMVSYRTATLDEQVLSTIESRASSPLQVCHTIFEIQKLSSEAKRYIQAIIDLPDEILAQISENTRSKLKIIQQYLGLDYETDLRVRTELLSFLSRNQG